MRNFLTTQVESYLGVIFISLLTLFFIGLFFIAIKNFNSDLAIINSEQAQVRIIK